MNAFNQLSQQDQMAVTVYIAQLMLQIVVISVTAGSVILSMIEGSAAPLKYGAIMVWTCIFASSCIKHPDDMGRFIWIYALGILLPWVTPSLCRHLWPKLMQKWRTR